MKSLSKLVFCVAAAISALPIVTSAQPPMADGFRQLASTVSSAKVTVLRAFAAYPVTLREVDLKRLGCTLTFGPGRSLTRLFEVLHSAKIKHSATASGGADWRFRIVFVTTDGTERKILFQGLGSADDGLGHGTVDGAYATADPSFPDAVRKWAEAQLPQMPAPKLRRCAEPGSFKN